MSDNSAAPVAADLYRLRIICYLLNIRPFIPWVSGDVSHVPISEEDRTWKGIDYFHINRGEYYFPWPGQWVGYPILDLENLN